jgi:hypothetical protein
MVGATRYCMACGTPHPDRAKYCSRCGQSLLNEELSQPSDPQKSDQHRPTLPVSMVESAASNMATGDEFSVLPPTTVPAEQPAVSSPTEAASVPMTYGESLSAAWLWTWRYWLFSGFISGVAWLFFFVVVFSGLGTTSQAGSGGARVLAVTAVIVIVAAEIFSFTVLPVMVIRMMLEKQYKNFHFRVRWHGVTERTSTTLLLREVIPIAWFLFWRSTAIVGLLFAASYGAVAYLVSHGSHEVDQESLNTVFTAIGGWIALLGVQPWVVRMMMRKRFRGCGVDLVHGRAATQVDKTRRPPFWKDDRSG